MKQINVMMIGLGRIGGKFFQKFTEIDASRVNAYSDPISPPVMMETVHL